MPSNSGFFTGRFQPDSITVADWIPPNSPVPLQVHMIFGYGADTIIVRLKSRAVADELIAALTEHRDQVWPQVGVGPASSPADLPGALARARCWAAAWKHAAKHWRAVAQDLVQALGDTTPDADDSWLCTCGHYQENVFHCSVCHREPPWGCDCSDCQDLADRLYLRDHPDEALPDPYFDDMRTPDDSAGELPSSVIRPSSGPEAPAHEN